MNVRLSAPTVRALAPVPQAALAPHLSPSMAPSLPAASLAPLPVLSAPQLAPSYVPAPAPPLALASLDAAQRPADSPPAVLFTAGRSAFDSQSAVPAESDAVPASFSMPSPLSRAHATPLHGAVAVPVSLPLAAAFEPTGSNLVIALGVALIALVVIRFLPFNRPKAPPPQPHMPVPSVELPALREQTAALTERLYASAAGIRDLRRAIRAIDAEWGRLRAQGGVAEWDWREGAWRLTPIHGSLFEAINLPDTLRIIERQGGGRNGDQLGDLLRGLSVEPERASSAEDLYGRLRWWNEHFRQYAARR